MKKSERTNLNQLHHMEVYETIDYGLDKVHHWMEEIFQEAQRRGTFEDLPGQGKPLDLQIDPFAGPDAEVYRALKQAGFLPEWVEMRRQIVDELNWLRANLQHHERSSRIGAVNAAIAEHNRKVPTPALVLPAVPESFGL